MQCFFSQLGEISTEKEDENVELRTNERDGLEELSRMTREFENFIKHSNDDEPRITLNDEKVSLQIASENENKIEVKVLNDENHRVIEDKSIKLETERVIQEPEFIRVKKVHKIEKPRSIDQQNENNKEIEELNVENRQVVEEPEFIKIKIDRKTHKPIDQQNENNFENEKVVDKVIQIKSVEKVENVQEIKEMKPIVQENKAQIVENEAKNVENSTIPELEIIQFTQIHVDKSVQKPNPISLKIESTDIKASEVKIVQLQTPETPKLHVVCELKTLEEQNNKDQVVNTTEEVHQHPCHVNDEIVENPQIVVSEDLKIDENENFEEQPPSIDVITAEVHQLLTEMRSFPEFQRLTPTPTPSREETPDFVPMTIREKFHVKLRIDEDEVENNIRQEEIEIKNEQQQIKNEEIIRAVIRDRTPIPLAKTELEEQLVSQGFRKVTKQEFLKFDEVENVELRRRDSDELIIREGDEPPKVPERRRSVKEIIESINRQQQKLKINQPPTPQFERKFYYGDAQKFSYHEKPALPSKENVLLKLKRQEEHERRMNELLDDLQKYPRDNNNNQDINPIPKPRRVN